MMKDAVFLRLHTIVDSVNMPGVVVEKKWLVDLVVVPRRSVGGGGFYVTYTHRMFPSNRVEQYKLGAPNDIGIVRTGLAYLVRRDTKDQYRILVAGDGKEEEKEELPLTLKGYMSQTHQDLVIQLSVLHCTGSSQSAVAAFSSSDCRNDYCGDWCDIGLIFGGGLCCSDKVIFNTIIINGLWFIIFGLIFRRLVWIFGIGIIIKLSVVYLTIIFRLAEVVP